MKNFHLFIKQCDCLKCRKSTESKTPKAANQIKENNCFVSKCAFCDSKKQKFIKEKEANGLLRSLAINISIRSKL